MALTPRFPIYIPTKGRAPFAHTPRVLDQLGVPYRLVVEEQERDEYERYFPPSRIITLDPSYRNTYDLLMTLEPGQSYGSGPARNFLWEHSISEGHAYHWTMDDNIDFFARLHRNRRVRVGDGAIFHAMETFVLRYANVAMAGPSYLQFAMARNAYKPFVTGTRIYSCNLIRNDVPFRWRGRYNEDTILSLDMLKAGWQTVQFMAFLQHKLETQTMRGGNTDAFYAAEGTLPKSQMLVDAHPDVARLAWRFGRVHHHVDYSQWTGGALVRRDDVDPALYEFDYSARMLAKQPDGTTVQVPDGKW